MSKDKKNINRRRFLQTMTGSFIVWQSSAISALTKPSGIHSEKTNEKKIIWVVLRGAMDSLHAVVPTFDPYLIQHRESLIKPIANQLRPLERGFGLHPKLEFLHNLYQKKQFSAVVAVASPYRQRSHFDAQDVLESGKNNVDHDDGWLARAINEYRGEGLAVARSIPVSMRGGKNTRTWYPSNLPDASEDLYERLKGLYQNDKELADRLQESIDTQNMVGDMENKRRPKFTELAQSCARLLKDPNGPDCAMLEMGGWDTHNALARRLDRQFTELDSGIKSLHKELGQTWKDTLVIIASEFGRTVKVNGTSGTDHGTGSSLLLCGGALSESNPGTIYGGKVLGSWPGLAPEKLFQNRDLQPTSDTFSWIGAALKQHWSLSSKQISKIFPESPTIALG